MWPPYTRSKLTLRALAIVARLCPSIESITLELNTTDGTVQDITRRSNTLRYVGTAKSHLDDADSTKIALFFLRLSSVDGLTVTGEDCLDV